MVHGNPSEDGYHHTHKNIAEVLPKRFRFGNSSTEITEKNSRNFSVRWTQGFGNPLLTLTTEIK